MESRPRRARSLGLLAALVGALFCSACSGTDDLGLAGGEGGGASATGGEGGYRRGQSEACKRCVAEDDVACYDIVAPETACLNDPDCGGTAGAVCGFVERTCDGGVPRLVCVLGCASDADCPPTQSCGPDGHCGQKPCGACDANFICGGEGSCVRAACQEDADCPAKGLCVNGLCHERLGACVD
jgi:hypothetical protein